MDVQAARKVCDRTFTQERPNAVTKSLSQFIVCSLPYSESNKCLGESDDWWLDETVVFEIYVADRKSADNPKEFNALVMKKLRNDLRDLFPVIDEQKRFVIARPRTVVNASSDGNGYHYSRIQAKMTTMV